MTGNLHLSAVLNAVQSYNGNMDRACPHEIVMSLVQGHRGDVTASIRAAREAGYITGSDKYYISVTGSDKLLSETTPTPPSALVAHCEEK